MLQTKGTVSRVLRNLSLGLVVGLFAAWVPANAQDTYVGLSLGNFEDAVLNDSDTGWKVYGGYQLSENLAVEGGYVNLGKVEESSFGTTVSAEQTGFNVVALGLLPLNQGFSLFGKIGLFFWDSDVKVSIPGFGSASGSDSGTDITYGFGLKYDIDRKIAVRGEWERFEDDIGDLLSIGVAFKF